MNGALAQLNRAFDYGSKGRRFESCRRHKKSVRKKFLTGFFAVAVCAGVCVCGCVCGPLPLSTGIWHTPPLLTARHRHTPFQMPPSTPGIVPPNHFTLLNHAGIWHTRASSRHLHTAPPCQIPCKCSGVSGHERFRGPIL